MNYVLAVIFAMAGAALLFWNKPLSERFGAFYAERFSAAFGKLANVLGWDDPRRPFNRLMYRGFVITAGLILLIFAFAALSGTNFVGPSGESDNSLLEARETMTPDQLAELKEDVALRKRLAKRSRTTASGTRKRWKTSRQPTISPTTK
jgi:hypothetical protein